MSHAGYKLRNTQKGRLDRTTVSESVARPVRYATRR